MKVSVVWNKRQIPDLKALPDWYVILGRVDASNYDVNYSCEEFFLVKTQAVKSPNRCFIVVGDIWLSNRCYLRQFLHLNQEYTDTKIIAHL